MHLCRARWFERLATAQPLWYFPSRAAWRWMARSSCLVVQAVLLFKPSCCSSCLVVQAALLFKQPWADNPSDTLRTAMLLVFLRHGSVAALVVGVAIEALAVLFGWLSFAPVVILLCA